MISAMNDTKEVSWKLIKKYFHYILIFVAEDMPVKEVFGILHESSKEDIEVGIGLGRGPERAH